MEAENVQKVSETGQKEVFKSFESQEDFEKFVEETKTKLAPELKKKLEKDAKMTAEQRLQAKVEELEQEKKSLKIEQNKVKAERLFTKSKISEEAYTPLLDFLVTDDEKVTLERTNKLLKFVETASKILADEKIKNTMKDVKSPKIQAESASKEDESGIAKLLGKIRANSERNAKETVDKYL